jgi:hypothetical protein
MTPHGWLNETEVELKHAKVLQTRLFLLTWLQKTKQFNFWVAGVDIPFWMGIAQKEISHILLLFAINT